MNLRAAAGRVVGRARVLLASERPIVLMYHRVETLPCDPWQLAVAPERFALQIEILGRSRRIVPMSWLAAELKAGRLPRRTAAVTFDDGYGDVHRNALPILQRAGCPATVFVMSGAIGGDRGYWWDHLSRIVLETSDIPAAIDLTVGAERIACEVGSGPGDRRRVHDRLHAVLRLSDPHERDAALERLAAWAGTAFAAPVRDRAMTLDQLLDVAEADEIEIGAHTVTHPSLPNLDDETLRREVVDSRSACREWTGRPVYGFAYPFGDHDRRTVGIVSGTGVDYACTTVPTAVRPRQGVFEIPRLLAADWDETTFRDEVLSHG